MTPLNSNDILRQEEARIQRRFESYGPEVWQAMVRVFGRFGHFRPLLTHLKLDSSGNLEAQLQTLQKCLDHNGAALFLKGVEQGKDPSVLKMQGPVIVTDELPATLKLAGKRVPEVKSNYLASPDFDDIDEIGTVAAPKGDRRKKSPGRRQQVALDYPNDRRRTPCRRTKTSKA